MESNGNKVVKAVAEKVCRNFSQNRFFSNLSSQGGMQNGSGCSKSASGSSSSNQPDIKSSKSLSDSVSDDDDDVIIIDDSDDDINIIEYEDVSSEMSSESVKQGNDGVKEEVAANNSHEEKEIANPLEPPVPELESEPESEEDHDWEIITIDDDDDEKPKKAPKDMICYRCTNKRTGTFKDERKYFAHIKRHVFPDHFSCLHCKRPFLKLNYCLSHELRVHGTPLEYEIKDPVIVTAKLFKKSKDKRNEPGPSTQEINKTDDEIDCEDVMFYDNRFVSSTTMYPYRGPPVETMLQAYEIQHFNSRKKAKRANCIAKIAIDIHNQNVKKDQDTYKLGTFSGKKGQRGNPVPVKANKPAAIKKSRKPDPIKSAKRPRDVASESENNTKEKPKQKRVRYEYISCSSSDVDNVDDVDYVPDDLNKTEGAVNVSLPPKPKEKVVTKRVFPWLMERSCRQCNNYEWKTEHDLRLHRDMHHPNVPMIDLMAYPVKGPKTSSKKIRVKESDKAKTVVVAKRANQKRAATVQNKKPPVEPVKKIRAQRKGRSQKLINPKPAAPLPDSTFSDKEIFLNSLGLTNCVRLHLYEKRPLEDLKLRQCSVQLHRMSDMHVSIYTNTSLQSLIQGHFLSL